MIERLIEKRLGSLDGPLTGRMRSAWGRAASLTGIGTNAVLFAIKLLSGVLSGSVAVTADAVNNLSDASSSMISLFGFYLADKPADADHPYGHGRYEYLSGLTVAVMVLVIGIELLKKSVEKILSPQPVRIGAAVVFFLAGSILMKLWLACFNCRVGRAIGSKALEATAADSRNDVISTSAVLLSLLISRFTGPGTDGYMGAAVAAWIIVNGIGLVKKTIDPMLGPAPEREFVECIRRKLESYPGVLGMHDLMVHDYGPGKQYASVHLELDAREEPMAAHDLIDRIEREFQEEPGLNLVIHHDPVAVDDPRLAVMKAVVLGVAEKIHPGITVHDLRIVPGNTHTNVVFDCVIPYDCDIGTEEIKARISSGVAAQYPDYGCVMRMEHSFVRTQR